MTISDIIKERRRWKPSQRRKKDQETPHFNPIISRKMKKLHL